MTNHQKKKSVWEKTKDLSADAWDTTKEVSAKAWDKTKELSEDAWDATKSAADKVSDKFSKDEHNHKIKIHEENNDHPSQNL